MLFFECGTYSCDVCEQDARDCSYDCIDDGLYERFP